MSSKRTTTSASPTRKPGRRGSLRWRQRACSLSTRRPANQRCNSISAGQQRAEQRADGFEAADFVGAEGCAVIALEGEDADADAAAGEHHRADRPRRGEIAMGDGHAGATFIDGGKSDAAPLIERFVHGVLEGGDELALLLEEGRVRQASRRARPPRSTPSDTRSQAKRLARSLTTAIASAGRRVVLAGHRQHVERGAGALQVSASSRGCGGAGTASRSSRCPSAVAGARLQGLVGIVRRHRARPRPAPARRVRPDRRRSPARPGAAQHLALAFTQALLRGRRQIGDVGPRSGPDGGRNEGATTFFEQQQGGAHVGDLHALQRQPTASAEVGRRLRRREGTPQGVVVHSSGVATSPRRRVSVRQA
jgi:hypothetical protein